MPQSSTLSVGLDVHQASSAVASVAQDHDADVLDLGTIGTRQADSDQLVRTRPSKATPLVCVDEAGPWGDWLQRSLTKKGHRCWVVAPSLMPQKVGDRVNTDRRDAVHLARLLRAGDLTPVSVPAGDDEASRDLRRAREDALADLKTAKFRLNALLLRHDIRDTGRATWGPAHLRGRSEVVCATPAQQIVVQAQVRAVHAPTERLQRLVQARPEQGKAWRLPPVVEALEALRGVPFTGAVTMVAERGDLTRFEHPRPVLTYRGLMPAAYSRGERRRQGSLTNAGHPHARRALLEGAWAYRYPANVSRHLPRRLAPLPKPSQDSRWKAHVRRCQRDRRVMARGTHANQGVVAMARELAGFRWAMATQVAVKPSIQPITPMGGHIYRQRRSPGVGSPSTA